MPTTGARCSSPKTHFRVRQAPNSLLKINNRLNRKYKKFGKKSTLAKETGSEYCIK